MRTARSRDEESDMTPESIAETIFAAFPAGDVETLRAVFALDGRVWHNYDRRAARPSRRTWPW